MASKYVLEHPDRFQVNRKFNQAVAARMFPPVSDCPCLAPGCRGKAHHYHHWSYLDEDILDVIPLCASHHKMMHTYGPFFDIHEARAEFEIIRLEWLDKREELLDEIAMTVSIYRKAA